MFPCSRAEPDAGFGIPIGDNDWAAPGFITNLRKTSFIQRRGRVTTQALTDVNNMLFKILATPDQ